MYSDIFIPNGNNLNTMISHGISNWMKDEWNNLMVESIERGRFMSYTFFNHVPILFDPTNTFESGDEVSMLMIGNTQDKKIDIVGIYHPEFWDDTDVISRVFTFMVEGMGKMEEKYYNDLSKKYVDEYNMIVGIEKLFEQ